MSTHARGLGSGARSGPPIASSCSPHCPGGRGFRAPGVRLGPELALAELSPAPEGPGLGDAARRLTVPGVGHAEAGPYSQELEPLRRAHPAQLGCPGPDGHSAGDTEKTVRRARAHREPPAEHLTQATVHGAHRALLPGGLGARAASRRHAAGGTRQGREGPENQEILGRHLSLASRPGALIVYSSFFVSYE